MDRVAPHGVFDAWSWCESDVVEWRTPRDAPIIREGSIDGDNPPDLVFVMHAECIFLPRELARLHAAGHDLADEWALAPYAIDDATDLLFERRVRPRDVFWIAAPSLRALVWGLHDWVHFHNHGPFDDPPMTELECDRIALVWLRLNADRIGVTRDDVERVRAELVTLTKRRFADAGRVAPELAY